MSASCETDHGLFGFVPQKLFSEDLSYTEFKLACFIGLHLKGTCKSVSDLSRRISLSSPTVRKALKSLMAKGFIKPQDDDADANCSDGVEYAGAQDEDKKSLGYMDFSLFELPLTPAAFKLLAYIGCFKDGWWGSIQTLCKNTGLSLSSVKKILKKAVGLGFLSKRKKALNPYTVRNLYLVNEEEFKKAIESALYGADDAADAVHDGSAEETSVADYRDGSGSAVAQLESRFFSMPVARPFSGLHTGFDLNAFFTGTGIFSMNYPDGLGDLDMLSNQVVRYMNNLGSSCFDGIFEDTERLVGTVSPEKLGRALLTPPGADEDGRHIVYSDVLQDGSRFALVCAPGKTVVGLQKEFNVRGIHIVFEKSWDGLFVHENVYFEKQVLFLRSFYRGRSHIDNSISFLVGVPSVGVPCQRHDVTRAQPSPCGDSQISSPSDEERPDPETDDVNGGVERVSHRRSTMKAVGKALSASFIDAARSAFIPEGIDDEVRLRMRSIKDEIPAMYDGKGSVVYGDDGADPKDIEACLRLFYIKGLACAGASDEDICTMSKNIYERFSKSGIRLPKVRDLPYAMKDCVLHELIVVSGRTNEFYGMGYYPARSEPSIFSPFGDGNTTRFDKTEAVYECMLSFFSYWLKNSLRTTREPRRRDVKKRVDSIVRYYEQRKWRFGRDRMCKCDLWWAICAALTPERRSLY